MVRFGLGLVSPNSVVNCVWASYGEPEQEWKRLFCVYALLNKTEQTGDRWRCSEMSTNEGQKVLTLFDVAWSVLTGMTHHAVDVTRPVFQYVVPEGEEIYMNRVQNSMYCCSFLKK